MSRSYQKSTKKSSPDVETTRQAASQLVQLVSSHGQLLVPMVRLLEQAQVTVGNVMTELGRAMLEAVLEVSAAEVAGSPHQGKRTSSDVTRHGRQSGVVTLTDRKITVNKPRLRRRSGGANAEVPIPAYAAMQNGNALQEQIFAAMMHGVTTRNYSQILPDACEAVGISKSSVSRQFVLASEQECASLLSRPLSDRCYPIIYIDGINFGDHHVIAAVGVDTDGNKQVLGLREGATENATVVKDLLQDMIDRGLSTGVKRLFVIDGSKALRSAISAVFGKEAAVQRCRVHKIRNVLDYLPKDDRDYARNAMRAAFRLSYKEGKKKLLKLVGQYDSDYPDAANSLREGLEELFTVQRLGVPKALARCLVSTNIIESANSVVRTGTNRVTDLQDGAMVMRWAASAFSASEACFRRVSGCCEIGSLVSALENDLIVKTAN
jgi:putative transposase